MGATVPIPTFYDFNTRKYSLSQQTIEMPKLSWFLDQIDITTNNIRTINFNIDIKHINQFINTQKRDNAYVNSDLIKEAVRLLPELNFISTGKAGYYSGHCIVLPLKKEGKKIALIGHLANDNNSPLGSWRLASDDHSAVTILEGMKTYTGNTLTYEKGVELYTGNPTFVTEVKVNTKNKKGITEAVEVAKNADVVVMVLGEHGFQSGEGRTRTNLDLPGLQQELLETVYKVNPNIVLVLQAGRPLTINWAKEHIPAIVMGWQLGTQTGNAIAQVLYGDYNPSGKLPMTFPRNVGQIPIYYNYKNTGRASNRENNVFWSHYSDVANTPLYPFGYGLSYTSFEYKNLRLNKSEFTKDETVKVSIELTNTGSLDGKEVVQLYIRDKFASVVRPVRELKGFELVALKKGETKTITFELTKDQLGFYNNKGEFLVEEGEFEVFVGGNSRTNLKASFLLR